MRWHDSFFSMKRGEQCQLCMEAKLEDTGGGMRFLEGAVADAYLQRQDVQPGYTVVVYKNRHVVEPTELSSAEATAYNGDVLAAARLLERHFEPVKTNYQTLGNAVPHLHTHIILRFEDDPRPGLPFPWPEASGRLTEDEFRVSVAALRGLAAQDVHAADGS